MVETSLHLRPGFSTFLQSDTNAGEDPLSYYNYQRLLRSQKVALLQEKRARAYVPGYKRPTGAADTGSRQIFQLQRRSPTQNPAHPTAPSGSRVKLQLPASDGRGRETLTGKQEPSPGLKSESKTALSSLSVAKVTDDTAVHEAENREELQVVPRAETERLSRTLPQQRRVRSATARQPRPTEVPVQFSRPKTVGGSPRRAHLVPLVGAADLEGGAHRQAVSEQGLMVEGKSLRPASSTHQRAVTDGAHQLVNLEEAAALKLPPAVDSSAADREALAHAYLWGTSTQRAYDEVGWAEKLPPPVPPPPSTLEPRPDPVSYRLNLKRHHTAPAGWQSFGPEWDFAQTRGSSFVRGPQGVQFCAPNRHHQQIPGYTGCIPGRGEADGLHHCGFVPVLLVRTTKPRQTGISRRANIPGYSGHVHWTRSQPAHSDMPVPEPTTSARVHRAIPLEEEPSPFRRNGVLSKMVKLVSPHNPFNKVEQ